MSKRPRLEGRFFAALLLVTLLAVATNKLKPVIASNDSTTDRPTIAKTYPGIPISSFEFESRWDKGALWDDQAPPYDLSYSNPKAHR
jgi:hypothetical protein